MSKSELVNKLNGFLLNEMPQYKTQAESFQDDYTSQRRLLRSLMNIRPPMSASEELLKLQDELLRAETAERGIVDVDKLNGRIALWQGDITRLNADAIVNAANDKLLGCFYPCHSCIDNAIHSAAGIQLRLECADIMNKQGFDEPTGTAKITSAYNLPCKYVIHTVGPIVQGELTDTHCRQLAKCYKSCLSLAAENNLKSIAFCCISTGEFHFPNEIAAQIAVSETTEFFEKDNRIEKVVFNVFKDKDYEIYKRLLKRGCLKSPIGRLCYWRGK